MPTYVTLIRFTQQGIERIKESPARFDAAKQAGQALGVELKSWYLTMGSMTLSGARGAGRRDHGEGCARPGCAGQLPRRDDARLQRGRIPGNHRGAALSSWQF